MSELHELTLRIADIPTAFRVRGYHLSKYGAAFAVQEPAELTVEVTEPQLDFERSVCEPGVVCSESYLEYIAAYRNFADQIWKKNAFIVHGASFCVDGEGVIFCAASGTGKTTHLRLWKSLLGEKMCIINGDKPIVRLSESGDPILYGTPYNGKENYGCNASAPLRHVCFIERSEENSTVPTEPKDALQRLLMQTNIPRFPGAAATALNVMDAVFRHCSFHTIRCNMEPSAAETAYGAVFGNLSKEN